MRGIPREYGGDTDGLLRNTNRIRQTCTEEYRGILETSWRMSANFSTPSSSLSPSPRWISYSCSTLRPDSSSRARSRSEVNFSVSEVVSSSESSEVKVKRVFRVRSGQVQARLEFGSSKVQVRHKLKFTGKIKVKFKFSPRKRESRLNAGSWPDLGARATPRSSPGSSQV